MTMPRLGLALIIGCGWLGGCASSPDGGTVAADAQKPEAHVASDAPSPCADLPAEVFEEYHEDGSVKVREEAVIGEDGEPILHGTVTHWWPNGQPKLELSFDCGVKDGTKRTWWPSGQLWSVGQTIDGKDHGTWTTWDENGTKLREFSLEHGVWHGPYGVWHPNGQKKLEFRFINGVRQGRMTMWDEQGNLVREVDYIDGEEQPMPGP